MERFRIGIIGAGHIAEKMSATLRGMDNVEAYAIASRDKEKAEEFAAKWGFAKSYGCYEELAEDPLVQLIYVATPHSFHYSHVRMCLEKGKPVLCEKSFMLNTREAMDVISLSHENGIFLAEAIWTRYLPSRRIIDDIIGSGAIGKPVLLTAHLGYPVAWKDRIMCPELGGGALLDLGVYCINFALMNFGDDVERIISTCTKSMTGVDLTDNIVFIYRDGRTAILTACAECADDRQGIIRGENGYVVVDNINNPLRIDVYDKLHVLKESHGVPEQITGFEYEVQACIDAIEAGKIETEAMPHSEIIKVMEIMDSLRADWGVHFPGERL
ncbi:MAG: Gfo/Idh/MocA family oxidoreductase [Clostridium sp.]|nr:Gfo/Idh/MocA family oxidoreductase [Bacteroides sp.]MCM1198754.1 Gfo/Idh/MocA family oxidoreductase [Clostridium sp.]